jgi:ADP-ribose pyrophosphatase YjhB (NUDIX family)
MDNRMSDPQNPIASSAPGRKFERRIPEGDTSERDVCKRCGHVCYVNPKIVVGSVVIHADHILLCRRAIEPQRGLWTLPAGYLELHESPEDGARREAREEACADIAIERLLAVYSLPHISQVQLIYRARLADPVFAAGTESLETKLFAWADIPWSELAFPSVHWALAHYRETCTLANFAPFTNP